MLTLETECRWPGFVQTIGYSSFGGQTEAWGYGPDIRVVGCSHTVQVPTPGDKPGKWNCFTYAPDHHAFNGLHSAQKYRGIRTV